MRLLHTACLSLTLLALGCSAAAPATRYNVKFGPLDPNVTDPAEFWMPLWNDVPQDYCTTPRYPIVPTPGPIAMDVLYDLIPNGTVPHVAAKPTNNWQKNLWGFKWDELPTGDQWGSIYPYPYVVSPKAGTVIIMYPGMPVDLSEDRAMTQGFAFPIPVPIGNPPIDNASYPFMTMAGSFDMVLQIRNGMNPAIRNMSDLGVTIDYRDPEDDNRTVATLYLVKGSPFINVECYGAELALGQNGIAPPIIGLNNLPPGQIVTGTDFVLTSAQGPNHMEAATWHVLFENAIGLNFASPPNAPINATAPYTGLVQIAVGELNDVEATLLRSAKGTYARDATVEYDVSSTNATVRFNFDVKGNGTLVMLAIPHQTELVNLTAHGATNTSFWCVKGNMTAFRGPVWNMTYNLSSVGFGEQLAIDPRMRDGLLRAAMLDYELRIVRCPGDNDTLGYPGYMNMELYAYVRDLASYTDVAITLEALGQREYATKLTSKMLSCMSWVLKRPEKAPYACPLPINNTVKCARDMLDVYFDQQWGGLITGWYDRFATGYCQCDLPGGPYACVGKNYCDNQDGWDGFSNYGNAFYNDHHFQYGYLVRNLAWALYYQEVKGVNLGMNKTVVANVTKQALAFARDIANPDPVNDKYFTKLRHKDAYDGHSWAEGYDYSGRVVAWLNQQSGGEAVNAYYGVYLLGLAIGDDNVRDWGRINMATEAQSISQYQHLSNKTKSKVNQPTQVIDEWGKCLPILFGNGASGATYYGPNPMFQCGITVLPISPYTREWVDADWAMEAYGWMQWHNNRSGECVFYDPLTMAENPCPGSYGSNWTGNEWGCCPTNVGYPDNQWRAWPDWYPTMYMFLATAQPMEAWTYLQYANFSSPTAHLPLPYLNSFGQVVGYHRTLCMTAALFHIATNDRSQPAELHQKLHTPHRAHRH
jgi:hypothetical protein